MISTKILNKYKRLVEAGLAKEEISHIHKRRTRATEERGDMPQLHRKCPSCAHLHPDIGEALTHCHCGYCRHATQIGTPAGFECEQCGEINPPFIELEALHFQLHEAPAES